MWMQNDSGEGMNWEDALVYAEGKEFAGYSDWRLPDVKELQSIVDYTRSPQTTASAAIDPLFNCTAITNEADEVDYPYYWSNTTHANWTEGNEGAWGAYVSDGTLLPPMDSAIGTLPPDGGDGTLLPPNGGDGANIIWTDVHGAGAQRSDPKLGDASEYPSGNGPQGDAIRIYNYVRLVRNVN
jgi:hypothetical protein